jgi:arylsulfate sulfotransferase
MKASRSGSLRSDLSRVAPLAVTPIPEIAPVHSSRGRLWHLALLAPLVLMITACGGGSGAAASSSAPPTSAPPSPQQVGSVSLSPQVAALGAGATQTFAPQAPAGSMLVWSVNGTSGGNAQLGTIDSSGVYRAPASLAQSTNVIVSAALAQSPQSDYATAVIALIAPGTVQPTANPQVALYQLELPRAGTVSVRFGTDTRYGLTTSPQSTPASSVGAGGPVTLEVAGMRGNTAYHLQSQVTLADGATFTDLDHVFTTGAPFPTPPLLITRPSGLPPQPGIELFDAVLFGSTKYDPTIAQAFATDLDGNVIWTYRYTGTPANVITPIKLLPNGHLLLYLTVTTPPNGPPIPAGTLNEVREIDLAGNTVHDLTIDALNQELVAAGFTGYSLFAFSHDVLSLPNGHVVYLAAIAKQVTLTGQSGSVNVAGDLLIDVDANGQPDWVWSTFDHLDVNRHPYAFPDWTHSDALLYSSDDHDLLLSVRNQNWIIKIDFNDGHGTGDVLWHLGEGGDFRLIGGVDPTDWFYAQHGMNFAGAATSGQFQLAVFDDGDDRTFAPGIVCGAPGSPPCLYSTAMVLALDESAMTATMVHHYIAPASFYSFFGGNVEMLANGDLEADFCSAKAGAVVQEYAPGAGVLEVTPSIVWQASTPGVDLYRVQRLPSLYPGTQW